MRHLELFENFNTSPDWKQKYLDKEGYYKGTEDEHWYPSNTEMSSFLSDLKSMGFVITELPGIPGGDPYYSPTLYSKDSVMSIGPLKYRVFLTLSPYRKYKTVAPETKGRKYPIVPRKTGIGEEPFETVKKFLSGELKYNDYINSVTKQGMTPDEAEKWAFGWEGRGSWIQFPGRTLFLKEDYEYDGDNSPFVTLKDDPECKEYMKSILPETYSAGMGNEIEKDIWGKLPGMIRKKVETLKEWVSSGDLEYSINKYWDGGYSS